ncbi:hypothetical protein OHA88_14760 [Streptomyces sp. NBC_00353]|uniref:hypothetical protein n=1 Tax=Streptomyces sp. NBC_00353 TaxID=2975722 RepID=UPI002E253489
MSKRTTVQRQPAKKEEARQPCLEFRAGGFHMSLNKVPWKVITALAGATVTMLAGGHPWML